MKYIRTGLIVATLLFIQTLSASPVVGSDAPDFELQDQYGKVHSLKDNAGSWIVLYFYPKDNTPGCTIEAGKFRDSKEQFTQRNTRIFGVSLDDVESHLEFTKIMDLNFSLLADVDKNAAKKYAVLTDFGLISYTKRETFIIDPDGRIAHHFNKVDPDTHTQEVLEKLDELVKLYGGAS